MTSVAEIEQENACEWKKQRRKLELSDRKKGIGGKKRRAQREIRLPREEDEFKYPLELETVMMASHLRPIYD